MKELIFVALILSFLAILEVNDTIVEVNLTPEERAKVEGQKEANLNTKKISEELALKNAQENESRLLSLSWGEVEGNEKAIWMLVKLLNLKYFDQIIAFMFILFVLVFLFSAVGKATCYFEKIIIPTSILLLVYSCLATIYKLPYFFTILQSYFPGKYFIPCLYTVMAFISIRYIFKGAREFREARRDVNSLILPLISMAIFFTLILPRG